MPFDPTLPQENTLVDAAQMRAQLNALKALIDAQPAVAAGRVAADWTSGSASFTDVTGLAFAVANGESWSAELVLAVVSGSGGQGLKFRVAGPGAASVLISMQGTGPGASSTSMDCEVQTAFSVASPAKTFCTGSSGSTAMECEVQTAFSVASPAKTFCSGSTLTGVIRIHVVVTSATAGGTVQLQASNSSGSGTVAIKANSDVVARRTG